MSALKLLFSGFIPFILSVILLDGSIYTGGESG